MIKTLDNTKTASSKLTRFAQAARDGHVGDTQDVIKSIRNLKAEPQAAYNTIVEAVGDGRVAHSEVWPVLAAIEQRFGW